MQNKIYSYLRVKRRPWDQVKGCEDAPRMHQGCTKEAPGMHQGGTRDAPRRNLHINMGPRAAPIKRTESYNTITVHDSGHKTLGTRLEHSDSGLCSHDTGLI